MFGNKERDRKIADLTAEVEALKKSLSRLDVECAPIRIGPEPSYSGYSGYGYFREDTRPKVSLHEVAERLMEHCGLRFEQTPITGGEIVVKDKKDDVPFIQSGANSSVSFRPIVDLPKKRKRRRK